MCSLLGSILLVLVILLLGLLLLVLLLLLGILLVLLVLLLLILLLLILLLLLLGLRLLALGIFILLRLVLLILLILILLVLLVLLLLLLLFQQFLQLFQIDVVRINFPSGFDFIQGIRNVVRDIKLRAAVEEIIGALRVRGQRGKPQQAAGYKKWQYFHRVGGKPVDEGGSVNPGDWPFLMSSICFNFLVKSSYCLAMMVFCSFAWRGAMISSAW